MMNSFTRIAFFLLCMIPLFAGAQKQWKETIELRDRRKANETPVVAKLTISAWWMTSRLTQGSPVLRGSDGKAEVIRYQGQPESYLKFKIEEIEFTDPEFDKGPEYKVIMRSLWIDLTPRPFDEKRGDLVGMTDAMRRKMFITAPNMEHEYGDSMPPPIIFKIDRSNRYTFTIGFTAITPLTDKEKPWDSQFTFTIDGLLRNGAGWGAVEAPKKDDSIPVVKANVPKPPKDTVEKIDTDEVDAAVAKAIADEDVETLKELMAEYPKYKSVIDAHKYLALGMRRELIDSSTYLVDIYYKKFTKALPTKEDILLSMMHNQQPFSLDGRITWTPDGKLFVTPPNDSTDYTLKAIHRISPSNWASTELNSFKDFINFTYVETGEGDEIAFKIKGGKGPYALHIQKATGEFYFDFEGSIKIYGDTVLSEDRIARMLKLNEEGDYRFFVEDADQLKKTGRNLVHIVPPPAIPPIVWYSLAGILFLAFIIFLLWRREQRRKDEEMEKLLASRGGKDPRVKRKPRPDLKEFWKETAISELSLHKNFIREVGTYLKERPSHRKSTAPMIEGIILGTVLRFDFETEQYEVRLDRFRAMDATALNYYTDKPGVERWPVIREISQDHKDLVRIGWLQVVDSGQMGLSQADIDFTDEQFSELFQLCLKIDVQGKERLCCFFTRTIAGKVNNSKDRKQGVDYWLDWDNLEDAGYYENGAKGVTPETPTENGSKIGVSTNSKTA